MPKLSKEDVISQLEEKGIAFDPNASYSQLLQLLKDNSSLEQKAEQPKEELVTKPETAEEKKAVKETINPFSSFESKTPMTGKAHAMRKKLMNQPRVPVMIPLGHEEKIGSTIQVTLNGYTLFLRKGQMIDVPVQVKEVLDEKFQHQINVRQHPLRVTGDLSTIKLQNFD